MGKITAWECDHTGQLFKLESDYRTHVRKVQRQLALEEKMRRQKEDEVARLQPMYQRSTFRALEKWILDNSALIGKFGRGYGRDRDKGNLVKVQLHDMSWGEQSCSHSAPLGQRTNWGSEHDGPKTFPGWHGHIVLWFDNTCYGFSDCLKPIGICTGGGGSGSDSGKTKLHPKGYCSSYEVTLWGADFPKLVPATGDLLDGSGWNSTNRTIASILHDIHHYDRSTIRHRVDNYDKLQSHLELLAKHAPGQLLSPYCALRNSDRREQSINFAARAFAREYPYYVTGTLDRKILERLQWPQRSFSQDNGVRFLARFEGLPLICKDAEPFVGWKLSGELDPNAKIVDLNQRLAALGAKSA